MTLIVAPIIRKPQKLIKKTMAAMINHTWCRVWMHASVEAADSQL